VELLVLTLIMGVFMSAAMNEFMSSLGAGLLTASLFFALAIICDKRKRTATAAVFVILGVLAGGAVSLRLMSKVADDPNSHFARLVRKSNEGSTIGGLLALRVALQEHKSLTGIEVRAAKLKPLHPDSTAVRLASSPDDTGGWLFDEAAGKVLVNCTHTDTKGSVWTGY